MLPEVCIWDLGSMSSFVLRTFLEHTFLVDDSWPLTLFQAKNLIIVPLT